MVARRRPDRPTEATLTNAEPLAGGCLCGAIRFDIAPGGVFDAGWCHCSMCRRATGTAASAWFNVRPDAFSFIEGAPAGYRSSNEVTRRFCPTCGSALSCEPDRPGGYIAVGTGCLDDSEHPAVRPRLHMFCDDRVSWFGIDDDLPRFSDNTLTHPDRR